MSDVPDPKLQTAASTLRAVEDRVQEAKRAIEAINKASSAGEAYIRDSEQSLRDIEAATGGGPLAQKLLRAMRNESSVSDRLSESLGRFPTVASSFHDLGSVDMEAFQQKQEEMLARRARNPVLETNERLNELIDQIDALVDVAKEQANLTVAIRQTAEATLQYSIQTGQEAKASTELARTSTDLTRAGVHLSKLALGIAIAAPIFSAMIGIAVSVYLDHRNTLANERRESAQSAISQQEIRVLNEISRRLAQPPPTLPSVKPQPKKR